MRFKVKMESLDCISHFCPLLHTSPHLRMISYLWSKAKNYFLSNRTGAGAFWRCGCRLNYLVGYFRSHYEFVKDGPRSTVTRKNIHLQSSIFKTNPISGIIKNYFISGWKLDFVRFIRLRYFLINHTHSALLRCNNWKRLCFQFKEKFFSFSSDVSSR